MGEVQVLHHSPLLRNNWCRDSVVKEPALLCEPNLGSLFMIQLGDCPLEILWPGLSEQTHIHSKHALKEAGVGVSVVR